MSELGRVRTGTKTRSGRDRIRVGGRGVSHQVPVGVWERLGHVEKLIVVARGGAIEEEVLRATCSDGSRIVADASALVRAHLNQEKFYT